MLRLLCRLQQQVYPQLTLLVLPDTIASWEPNFFNEIKQRSLLCLALSEPVIDGPLILAIFRQLLPAIDISDIEVQMLCLLLLGDKTVPTLGPVPHLLVIDHVKSLQLQDFRVLEQKRFCAEVILKLRLF